MFFAKGIQSRRVMLGVFGGGEDAESTAKLPKLNYLYAKHGLLSWLLTEDHKRIAILYMILITFFFLLGGIFAGMIRLELRTPQADLVASDTYN